MSEPLPCPFCGQIPERPGLGLVETACEAECILYGYCCTEDDWSRRTPPPATAELLKWLKSNPDDFGIQACHYGLLKCLYDFLSDQS